MKQYNLEDEFRMVYRAKSSQVLHPVVAETLQKIVEHEECNQWGVSPLWVACLAFCYGVSWGRRDERARRRGKPIFERG